MSPSSYAALLHDLSRWQSSGGRSLEDLLTPVAREVGAALRVSRVSVWLYPEEDRTHLECVALCDTGIRKDRPERLRAEDYPTYFAELDRARCLPVEDAVRDPRTRELAVSYLEPEGIVAMLDAAIHTAGRVAGIVCCETREPRTWSEDDESAIASVADLVARIVAEHQKAELNGQLRALLDASSQAVLVIGEQGRVRLANPAATRLFGKSVSDLEGAEAEFLVAPSARGLFRKAMGRFFSGVTPSPSTSPTHSLALRGDGTEVPVDVTVSAVDLGRERQALALISDVSERVRAEREIARREELYRRVVEEQEDLVLRSSPEGRVLFANAAAQRFVSGGLESRLPENLLEHVPEADRRIVLEAVRPLTPADPSVRYEHRIRRHDGVEILHSFHTRAFFDEEGRLDGYQAIGRDIEKEREREALLREAQRIEALAVLSSGIAHDFNNLLTPIMALSEMLLADSEARDEDAEALRQILHASDRARDLVRQILMFARRDKERASVAAAVAIREAVAFVRASLPASIRLTDEVDDDCGVLLAAPSDLYQIVSNLCTNAIQAMPAGGELTLTAERIGRGATEILQLLVRDSGVGMSEEVRAHIFEPFFTTKSRGHGTGLGLSVVHGTVQSLGGSIDVQSVVGKGTTFLVELPLTNRANSERVSGAFPATTAFGRVLVVDDEPAVAMSVRCMLEHGGIPTTTRHSANEALVELLREPTSFGVLVTDLTMPHLGGVDLAFRARQANGRLPIVLMSGFGQVLVRSETSLLPGMVLLSKPFSRKELFQAMDEARAALAE